MHVYWEHRSVEESVVFLARRLSRDRMQSGDIDPDIYVKHLYFRSNNMHIDTVN